MSKEKISYTKTQIKKEFTRLMEKTSIIDNLPAMETLMLYSRAWGLMANGTLDPFSRMNSQ